jgi:hypothetical protein
LCARSYKSLEYATIDCIFAIVASLITAMHFLSYRKE